MVHAITMSIYGAWATFSNFDMLRPMTEMDKKMLIFSVGYNLYDLAYESYTKTIVPPILIHHIIMTVMNTYSVYTEQHATILCVIYFLGETTNPLLCIHQNLGSYKSFKLSSEIFGLIYCPLFIFIRVFVSGFFFILWVQEPKIPLIFSFVFSIMFYIGLQWSFQTLNKWFKDLKSFFDKKEYKGLKGNPYEVTNKLRYNKTFQFCFKATLISVCFLPHFFFSHDNWL